MKNFLKTISNFLTGWLHSNSSFKRAFVEAAVFVVIWAIFGGIMLFLSSCFIVPFNVGFYCVCGGLGLILAIMEGISELW